MSKGKKEGDKPEYLTPAELDRIESVVVGDLFFSTFYRVLRYSGRRIGEIVGTNRSGVLTGGIKVKDVDLDKKQMKTIILKTKKRKLELSCTECNFKNTNKNNFCSSCGSKLPEFDKDKLKYSSPEERIIPLREEVIGTLRVYLQKNKSFKDNHYLFRKYSLSYLKKKIKIHCNQASIEKNFSLHGFRHCFVTNCKKKGMSNEDIALWTGHKNPETLNTYNQMVPDDVREKIMDIKF